ncbi:hypothetical protein FRC01_009630, partial [Tulasnella sp. 417]
MPKKLPPKNKRSSAAEVGPQYDPEPPVPSFQGPSPEGPQSQEGSLDFIPSSPPLSVRAREDLSLPPSRLATPPPFIPRSDDDAQSDTGSADESIRGLPPHREAPTGADIPRLVEEPRMGEYFQKRRDLLNILKSLHSTGIQNELDLPQIVVIGSQSVGKSSLIESMSGWNMHKASLENPLQLTSAYSNRDPFMHQMFHVDRTGQPLTVIRNIPFGPTLYNAEDVEKMLRRAQRAILRPDLDPSIFVDDSDLHVFGVPLTFSRNCVCIQVSGPNVPDLYFYDLPGIIANVGDGGNVADIKLVEDLAKSYIKKPNCIVLLVISCETDFENQGAGRLVLKDPALRQRTIGVLTK